MTTLKQHKPVPAYQWQPAFTASSSSINILVSACSLPIKDHLGTIHALVNSSGSVVESYTYDAWGRVLSIKNGSGTTITKSAVGNRYLWQGREYSFSTSLYYFRARWYESITGRWLSNDPIGISGGLNMYEFCGSNPVNLRDPSGLCGDDIDLSFQIPMSWKDQVINWMYAGRPVQVLNLESIVNVAKEKTKDGNKIKKLVIYGHSGQSGFATFSYDQDQNMFNGRVSSPEVQSLLSELGGMMSQDGEIYLMQCSVGAGTGGTETLSAVSSITGVKVTGATEDFRFGLTPSTKTVLPDGSVTEKGTPRKIGAKKKFR